jgi:hypothetical protein
MGWKFYLLAAKYPYQGSWDYSFGDKNLLRFIIHVIKIYKQYEIIDIQIRNF